MGNSNAYMNETDYCSGYDEGYSDAKDVIKDILSDLIETVSGLRRYARAGRAALADQGKAYLGNNLVALSENAMDLLLRLQEAEEESNE